MCEGRNVPGLSLQQRKSQAIVLFPAVNLQRTLTYTPSSLFYSLKFHTHNGTYGFQPKRRWSADVRMLFSRRCSLSLGTSSLSSGTSSLSSGTSSLSSGISLLSSGTSSLSSDTSSLSFGLDASKHGLSEDGETKRKKKLKSNSQGREWAEDILKDLAGETFRGIDGDMYHIAEPKARTLPTKLVLRYPPPTVHLLARIIQRSLPSGDNDRVFKIAAIQEGFSILVWWNHMLASLTGNGSTSGGHTCT